ncbi:hypothetical protein ACFLY9_00255, partial [Patescibacteria group bacterium]
MEILAKRAQLTEAQERTPYSSNGNRPLEEALQHIGQEGNISIARTLPDALEHVRLLFGQKVQIEHTNFTDLLGPEYRSEEASPQRENALLDLFERCTEIYGEEITLVLKNILLNVVSGVRASPQENEVRKTGRSLAAHSHNKMLIVAHRLLNWRPKFPVDLPDQGLYGTELFGCLINEIGFLSSVLVAGCRLNEFDFQTQTDLAKSVINILQPEHLREQLEPFVVGAITFRDRLAGSHFNDLDQAVNIVPTYEACNEHLILTNTEIERGFIDVHDEAGAIAFLMDIVASLEIEKVRLQRSDLSLIRSCNLGRTPLYEFKSGKPYLATVFLEAKIALCWGVPFCADLYHFEGIKRALTNLALYFTDIELYKRAIRLQRDSFAFTVIDELGNFEQIDPQQDSNARDILAFSDALVFARLIQTGIESGDIQHLQCVSGISARAKALAKTLTKASQHPRVKFRNRFPKRPPFSRGAYNKQAEQTDGEPIWERQTLDVMEETTDEATLQFLRYSFDEEAATVYVSADSEEDFAASIESIETHLRSNNIVVIRVSTKYINHPDEPFYCGVNIICAPRVHDNGKITIVGDDVFKTVELRLIKASPYALIAGPDHQRYEIGTLNQLDSDRHHANEPLALALAARRAPLYERALVGERVHQGVRVRARIGAFEVVDQTYSHELDLASISIRGGSVADVVIDSLRQISTSSRLSGGLLIQSLLFPLYIKVGTSIVSNPKQTLLEPIAYHRSGD